MFPSFWQLLITNFFLDNSFVAFIKFEFLILWEMIIIEANLLLLKGFCMSLLTEILFFDKVFVIGKNIIFLFDKLSKSKKGGILQTKAKIIKLIKNDLNNNDYLMVKASNATGLNMIVKDLKSVK